MAVTDGGGGPGSARATGAPRRRLLIAVVSVAAALAALLLSWNVMFPYAVGERQPLPFSHQVHAAARQISCLFCHDGADRSPVAGIPEVAKCMLCHRVEITGFPPIRELRGYYERGEPIPWVRVYRLPDFVYFNHEVHLAAAVDCGRCHGDVRAMDRILSPQVIDMGFCVDCHRANGATVDCLACHR